MCNIRNFFLYDSNNMFQFAYSYDVDVNIFNADLYKGMKQGRKIITMKKEKEENYNLQLHGKFLKLDCRKH